MTIDLTTKHKAFIKLMTENPEQAQWGFDLLLQKPGFEYFFDHLDAAGLFSPEQNPPPVPSSEPGYIHIPFWFALNYLEAVATRAGENNDLVLAEKVMNVVRKVSRHQIHDNRSRDNERTNRVFATILGLVPTTAVTPEDIELIPLWMRDGHGLDMVGPALDKGALKKFLASDSPEDWHKACRIVFHCTAIRWLEEKERGDQYKKPVTLVKDYWLRKLLNQHTAALGERLGREAAELFVDRLRSIYDLDSPNKASSWRRPAVEDHEQNYSWKGPENRFVEGLRDILLSWTDHNLSTVTPFIESLLIDQSEIVRRIAIHVLDRRWLSLRHVFFTALRPQLFDRGHLHELYLVLKNHFHDFSFEERRKTVDAIRGIPLPQTGDEPEWRLKYLQRQWLSAIAGQGYDAADALFQELQSDESLGRMDEHPEFKSYMETWTGPGPSPYSVDELLSFVEDGSIVIRLNAFEPSGDFWRGPSIKALVDTLEAAIAVSPLRFVHLPPLFAGAKRSYQYGLINGFKQIWDAPKDNPQNLDWEVTWDTLVSFFEVLITDAAFWEEEVEFHRDLTPNRDWIPPIIATFLRAGTQKDEKAYPPSLLPRTLKLIEILLEKLEPEPEASDDAMTQAINSSKGKAIEALYSHALRVCRLSDQSLGEHTEAWETLRPFFENELVKCTGSNFEFSTLAGCYLANLDYISRSWLQDRILQIFPIEHKDNFACALEGLAYTPATRIIYALLAENKIVENAFHIKLKGRHARESLIERIALAYLWGDEQIDSPGFSLLFHPDNEDDLVEAARFFWSISKQQLTTEQIERIVVYWEKCVEWCNSISAPPARIFSTLSRLSCYFQSVGDRETRLLRNVAPYVHEGYNTDDFIEELDRLVETNPAAISAVVGIVIKAHIPVFDYQDRIKSLLKKLSEFGLHEDALRHADQLRTITGMVEFFEQLRHGT